jgi:anti-anti-sigma factor
MSPDPGGHKTSAVHVAPLEGGGTGLTIFGELDAANGSEASEALERAIAGEGPVMIDLRACGFVDSKGIAVLAFAAVHLKDQERVLILRGVSERVLRVFELAGLAANDSIEIEPEAQFAERSA